MINQFKILIVISLVFTGMHNTYAQKKKRGDFYGQSKIDLLRSKVSRHGLIMSAGITNMFSFDERRAKILDGAVNTEYFFVSGGKPSYAFEIGMMHFTKKSHWQKVKIDNYDWAFGVKNFQGWEETNLIIRNDPNSPGIGQIGRGDFSLGYLTGRYSVHQIYKIKPRISFTHGIGVNVDYRVYGNTRGDLSSYVAPVLPETQKYQRDYLAQIHYEIGFRLRAINLIHITPMLHVPLISGVQWTGGRSTIDWFSSRYQPWMIKFKIMFPKAEKQSKCPATYSNPDDERRNKEYLEGK